MEYKTVREFREIGSNRVVTGYPAVCGNVDDSGDVIRAGAFRKTLAERASRLRWLWQHDWGSPPTAKILDVHEVGRGEMPGELLEKHPEAEGALLVRREYLETPRGDEVWRGIESGALNEMSIGFDAILSEAPAGVEIGERPVRRMIKEIRLWEMSDVNWGMNAATMNAKSLWGRFLGGEELDEEEREALRKEIGALGGERRGEIVKLFQPMTPGTVAGVGGVSVGALRMRVTQMERALLMLRATA